MITKITAGKKSVAAALITFGLAAGAAAQQETFRVTQVVETDDGRTCRVLSVSGRTAKVGCGEDGSDLRTYKFEQMKSQADEYWKRDAERRKQQAALDAEQKPQTLVVRVGNTVKTPDGRTGVIESFRGGDMSKVKFGETDSKYYMSKDLEVVEPAKPARTTPVETFRVGDIVINPKNPNQQLRIEAIRGNTADLRYGNGNYNIYKGEKLEDVVSLKTWERMQDDKNRQKIVHAQFLDEAEPYMKTVKILANSYNPQFFDSGDAFTASAAERVGWAKDMEALAAICAKYPGMTNGDAYSNETISQFPADVCKLAEQRTSVIDKTRSKLGNMSAGQEIHSWSLKLNEAARNSEGLVEDDIQMLMYERSAWEQQHLKFLKKKYTDLGAVMPPDALKPLDEHVAKQKEIIESAGASRTWQQPHAADAAMESLARRRAAIDYPGSQVLKTGMTFATWKVEDTKTFVGGDNFWRYYKINPGAFRYKMGLALIKMPNRPLCQIREFQVSQPKAGGGFGAAKASFAAAGIFVKCP
jgi:hypothetical protein